MAYGGNFTTDWQNATSGNMAGLGSGQTIDWAGGKLTNNNGNFQYAGDNGATATFTKDTDPNQLAAQNPNIAAQWTGDPERDATAGAGSAFVQGALVGGTTAGGISGIQSGMEFARQKLDELRGTSVGKPDVTPPKTKTPSVSTGDIDSNIEGSISSVDIASNTVSNIVDQKKDVTLAIKDVAGDEHITHLTPLNAAVRFTEPRHTR